MSWKTRLNVPLLFLPWLVPVHHEARGQQRPGDYRSVLASAQNDVIETQALRIEKLDLGQATVGENRFRAMVHNKTDQPVALAIDLRADPGLWLKKWQRQFVFEVDPGAERSVEATYLFPRMSAEARLRVRLGIAEPAEGGGTAIGNWFFRKYYPLGVGNEAADYDLSNFELRQTHHYDIHYLQGSLAAAEIQAIVTQRESAYRGIADLLGASYEGRIRLFFFPDEDTKRKETGHTGSGWAFSNFIIEVYNERTKLDPYHELVHILAGELGNPPALFGEGLAVYVSERLGADALRFLGHPGRKVDDVAGTYHRQGELIPLEELFAFTEIGSPESRPPIAYPQAASVVKFLVETYGIEAFRRAYGKLRSSSQSETIENNRRAFREVFGRPLPEVERAWLERLR
ncbi:MAG: hypothetical protein GTO22_11625 [Gemmatimonadales bacterium]|nr:hypothetical protein [Gemmatimonadales bacterium]